MTSTLKVVSGDRYANETTGAALTDKVPAVIEDAISKFIELGKLKDGWDSYNAKAPSNKTLYAAACLVNGVFDTHTPAPEIVPVPNGNVQIEWSRENKEVEVEVKSLNVYELYFHDLTTGVEFEKTLGYDFEELREIIIQLGESNRPALQVVNG